MPTGDLLPHCFQLSANGIKIILPFALPNPEWADYQLLDSGEGKKLERLGPFSIMREEPCANNHARTLTPEIWNSVDARHEQENGWQTHSGIPETWPIRFGPLTLQVRLAPGFKHIGIFPEQAPQWQWLLDYKVHGDASAPKLLNLFGHTGAATLAAAHAGFVVTHVDSSRPAINQARHNQDLSGLGNARIQWIHEDAQKFVERQLRRGKHYEAILLDPPVFGRGPKGQTWQIGQDLTVLLEKLLKLLSGNPRFLFLNLYAGNTSANVIKPLLQGKAQEQALHQGAFTLNASNGPSLQLAEWLCLDHSG